MKTRTRLSLFILIIGVAITLGTIIEGINPLTILHEESVTVPSDSNSNVLIQKMLYAKKYRWVVQVREGGPVDIVFFQIGGPFRSEHNSTLGFSEISTLSTKAFYNCTIYNIETTSVTVRISLTLFGPDQQQLIIGYIIFWAGFAMSLICIVYDWKKQPSSSTLI
ncbi:MAG: hypothetical protein ACFFCH_06285 [Promethearchaeota archaeon]